MRLNPEDSLLAVIDFQEKLVPHIHNYEQVVARAAKLIRGMKALGVPVVVTQQYTRGLGSTVHGIADALGYEDPADMPFMEKQSFSCLDCDEFKAEIDKSGKNNIIICGIEGHVCVLQTIVDLKNAGYNPVPVLDCISSRRSEDMLAAIKRYEYEKALPTGFESVLFELCRVSGTDTFKVISGLVK
jgi:nicotinamidase-related amidase